MSQYLRIVPHAARQWPAPAPVLVLDEPTPALDTGTEALLISALERLMADRKAIVIGHRTSIRRAGRLAVLEGGKAADPGTHEELLAAGGAYHRLWTFHHGPAPCGVGG